MRQADAQEMSGLRTTQGRPVPLVGVKVEAEIPGGHAAVKVRQRYRNAERKPVEAVYTFPLPADATLVGFAMICEGRRLEGTVRERERAFREYDDALLEGHGAALLEQERPNVFTANVGNLLPGEETIVEVEYLQRLRLDEGALRFVVPTLVAPRYIPGSPQGDRTAGGRADPTDRVPDADRITPPVGDAPYGLALDLVLSLGADLEVESPSHELSVKREDGRVRVSFTREEVALDRDVVVVARGAKEGPVAGVAAHRAGAEPGWFSVAVLPDLLDGRPAAAQNVVFVVDTSGSMDGASLPEAKAALRLCLRHLRAGDRFDIVEFNTSMSRFAREPVAYGEKSLADADRWVAGLRATGGTELLAPLVEAVRAAKDGVVFLLTDGQVGNEAEILDAVLQARGTTRVYSFGIGTNVSDTLLRDLARHTGGGVEFIHPGERIDDKVLAQFARAIARRVEGVETRIVGVEAGEVSPEPAPALVDGEPWTLFGRYASPGGGTLQIRGRLDGAPWALDVPLDLPAQSERPVVRRLWAAERIRDLVDREVAGRRAQAMKDRILKIALEYGVSSPYTSFLVVEHRSGDRRAKGQPETRVVPVSVPAGWAMFEKPRAAFDRGLVMACMSVPSMPSSPVPGALYARPPAPAARAKGAGVLGRAAAALDGLVSGGRRSRSAGPKDADADDFMACEAELPAEPPPARADPVASLLGRQLASGLWDDGGPGPDEARRARATALALLDLLDAGVTTSHRLHGAQVKKAVEALVPLAATLADARLAALALGAAWLAATGRRSRAQIERVARGTPALSELAARLGAADLRRHLDALR